MLKMNKIINSIVALSIVLALAGAVSAFGVSSPYWTGENPNPLNTYAGAVVVVPLNLQNKAGATEDVTAQVEIVAGSEIASLQKSQYLVAASSDVNVPLTITIPADAPLGTIYLVKVSTKTVTPGAAGGVSMGVGATTSFNVIVGEKPAESAPNQYTAYLSLAIILVLALIIYLLVKRKRK